MERTFAIIKPDAFRAGNAGKILARIYAEGFRVVGMKKLWLSKKEAEDCRRISVAFCNDLFTIQK